MGKNNKYDNGYKDPILYDEERNKQIADDLEEFITQIDEICILNGKNVKDVKDAMKKIKKAIKYLRNNEPEKVFNIERFYEYVEEHGLTRM